MSTETDLVDFTPHRFYNQFTEDHPDNSLTDMHLAYATALTALKLGRAAFFGSADADLPNNRSPLLRRDDLTPQFGYVGNQYSENKVLLFGINPGNGKQTEIRSPTDARMMPALIRFAEEPTAANFVAAEAAYKAECQTWHVWRRHCAEIIGAGKLSLEQVAYSNCLPWRTGSESAFGDRVAERAANLWAAPLVSELEPTVIIAVGKTAGHILGFAKQRLPRVIVWNRAQAATPAVLADRARAAKKIFATLSRY